MIPTEREIDQIAEYADASVRGMTRKGSLAPIRGRHGLGVGARAAERLGASGG